MEKLLIYLLMVSVCQAVLYIFFRFYLYSKVSYKSMRLILVFIMLISIALPLHSIRVETNQEKALTTSTSEQGLTILKAVEGAVLQSSSSDKGELLQSSDSEGEGLPLSAMLKIVYMLVCLVFSLKFLSSLTRIVLLHYRSENYSEEYPGIKIIPETANSFSFFNWIFINPDGKTSEEKNNIIIHEKIHASQMHSLDIILFDLSLILFWFNPGIWLMRRTLQQVHEYLADEGALNTGVNRPMYQALLLNQVAEERLIALSSGFNPAFWTGRHSLIKKRIVMMTKPKLSQKANLRLLTIIPILGILFLGIACVNGQRPDDGKNRVAAVANTKMNVLYLGVDNPMSIAVSGYEADELEVTVENGRIVEEGNGKYIIRPIRPRNLKVFIHVDGKLVSETQFRVKTVPNPVAKIGEFKGGEISKEELLSAGKLHCEIENFDFDLRFVVVSYVMSATSPNSYTVREEISTEEAFSAAQIDLINSLVKNQKLMIEEIIAHGPDGSKRPLGAMVFTIK